MNLEILYEDNHILVVKKLPNIPSQEDKTGDKDMLSLIKDYIKETNRRVTFEYILLKDVNDSEKCALELVKLLKGINCYVNLIPYNETSHIEYKKSSQESIMRFYDILKKNNIGVTIRREFGSKVNAACGQLRSHYEEV